MTILITGGAGYIGIRLTGKLIEKGQRVICFDTNAGAAAFRFPGSCFRAVSGSVESRDDITTILQEERVQTIVHLAYLKGADADLNPHLAMRVNLAGTDNVFEAARLAKVPRIVFGSSVAANGSQEEYGDRAVDELQPCFPHSTYGAMKWFNEWMAGSYSRRYGMEIISLRIGNVYGHGRKQGTARWLQEYASLPAVGRPVEIPFAPSRPIYLVYEDDVAEMLARLCLAKRLHFFTYFGVGHCAVVGDLARIVRDVIPEARISFPENPGAPALQFVYRIDSTRFYSEFGMIGRSLEQGVRDHINEARADPGLKALL